MSSFVSHRMGIASLLVCICFWYPKPSAQAQTQSQRSQWFSAQNRWRLTVVDPQSQKDTATPELRAKRNAYLQPLLKEAREWREPDLPPGVISGLGGLAYNEDEMPELPSPAHAVWVIAKFESFHVFATDPQYRLIYTEINYRVQQIIRQPPSLSLETSSELDLVGPGGRIRKPDGTIASFSVDPERRAPQPGGTYLMVGTYDPATEYFKISNDNWWDLTSGKVVPSTVTEIDRAAKGNSKLNGLTTAQAVKYLDSVLPSSN